MIARSTNKNERAFKPNKRAFINKINARSKTSKRAFNIKISARSKTKKGVQQQINARPKKQINARSTNKINARSNNKKTRVQQTKRKPKRNSLFPFFSTCFQTSFSPRESLLRAFSLPRERPENAPRTARERPAFTCFGPRTFRERQQKVAPSAHVFAPSTNARGVFMFLFQ